MIGATATTNEMRNNLEKYLSLMMSGQEIVITQDGQEVGRLIPKDTVISSLTKSLTGILKGSCDPDQVREERLRGKYEVAD